MFRKFTALLLVLGILLPTVFVFADDGFDYITITGPGITGEIDVTNSVLTQDLAFADFTQGEVPAPYDPGQGYQVVRTYVKDVDGKPKDVLFDQLHYYPYTGYVHYDGRMEETSEYDGKWFLANPVAEAPFRNVLVQRALLAWIPLAVLVAGLVWFFIAYTRKPKKQE